MNAERLLVMAEFLEALPAHKFDFATYVHIGDKQPLEALAAPEEHCGTTACAVGWMPAIFPDAFEWSDNSSFYVRADLLPFPKTGLGDWIDGETGIKKFLGLDEREYNFLFIPDQSWLNNDALPNSVAAQIREFVATDGENMEEWRTEQENAGPQDNDSYGWEDI